VRGSAIPGACPFAPNDCAAQKNDLRSQHFALLRHARGESLDTLPVILRTRTSRPWLIEGVSEHFYGG